MVVHAKWEGLTLPLISAAVHQHVLAGDGRYLDHGDH